MEWEICLAALAINLAHVQFRSGKYTWKMGHALNTFLCLPLGPHLSVYSIPFGFRRAKGKAEEAQNEDLVRMGVVLKANQCWGVHWKRCSVAREKNDKQMQQVKGSHRRLVRETCITQYQCASSMTRRCNRSKALSQTLKPVKHASYSTNV